jgi:hypothetical protein
MSAFMDTATFVACDECDLLEYFDRWGEAEIFMEDHNQRMHKE